MRKTLFYLLFAPLLLGLTACSKDDDEESPEEKEQSIKESIVGRWHQLTGAKLDGEDAYFELHLKADGTGHAVFKTSGSRSDIKVSYSPVTYTLSGEKIMFNSNVQNLNGTFTLKSSYSSSFTLNNASTSEDMTFYKSDAESELLSYKWQQKLTDSYIKNYYMYEFQSSSTGTMRHVKSSSRDYEDYSFTYTFDYANGPMTINYSDGSKSNYFYSVHCGIDLILFSRKSGSSDVYYSIWTRK